MADLLKPGTPFRVAMLLFPRLTQLDLTGPYEVFASVPGVEIQLMWKNLDPIVSESGLKILPTHTLADAAQADLLCVPGGPGQIDLMTDDEVLSFLQRAAAQAKYVTSVCTGSLLLGAAGLLKGYRATTYWASLEDLSMLGATTVRERVVIDRNRITGGGVTAGIDFALTVVAQVWGPTMARIVQLGLEYNPAPPFNAGSPEKIPADELQRLQKLMQPGVERRRAATMAAVKRLTEK
jgi:cyclohexyl-isocyanide hydratase